MNEKKFLSHAHHLPREHCATAIKKVATRQPIKKYSANQRHFKLIL